MENDTDRWHAFDRSRPTSQTRMPRHAAPLPFWGAGSRGEGVNHFFEMAPENLWLPCFSSVGTFPGSSSVADVPSGIVKE